MERIGSGKLKENGKAYQVRRLIAGDIPAMQFVQKQAVHQLNNPDTLQCLSQEEFEYILDGNGLIIGAFADNQLIAFRALLVPPINEEHLGFALGLDDKLDEIIYQEISVVHPAYRGNKLQQKLAYLIMKKLTKQRHSFTYVCATVAPHNIPSLKDKFNQRMMVGALIEIYDGKLRYVFVKDLKSDLQYNWEDVKVIPTSETEIQRQLLKDGWVGFQLIQDGDRYSLKYGKR